MRAPFTLPPTSRALSPAEIWLRRTSAADVIEQLSWDTGTWREISGAHRAEIVRSLGVQVETLTAPMVTLLLLVGYLREVVDARLVRPEFIDGGWTPETTRAVLAAATAEPLSSPKAEDAWCALECQMLVAPQTIARPVLLAALDQAPSVTAPSAPFLHEVSLAIMFVRFAAGLGTPDEAEALSPFWAASDPRRAVALRLPWQTPATRVASLLAALAHQRGGGVPIRAILETLDCDAVDAPLDATLQALINERMLVDLGTMAFWAALDLGGHTLTRLGRYIPEERWADVVHHAQWLPGGAFASLLPLLQVGVACGGITRTTCAAWLADRADGADRGAVVQLLSALPESPTPAASPDRGARHSRPAPRRS